jgi:hypothetical protein
VHLSTDCCIADGLGPAGKNIIDWPTVATAADNERERERERWAGIAVMTEDYIAYHVARHPIVRFILSEL